MKVQKTLVAVRLLPSQLTALDRLAGEAEDVTVSSLIRDAITAFVMKSRRK